MSELLTTELEYLQSKNEKWEGYDKNNNVLNGIAYQKETETFFVTGKNWHFLT